MNPTRVDDLVQSADRLTEQIQDFVTAIGDRYVPDIAAARRRVQTAMGSSPDLVMRSVLAPSCRLGPVLIAYLASVVHTQMVDQDLIAPLLRTARPPESWDRAVLAVGHITGQTAWSDMLRDLASGHTLIFVPGIGHVWSADTAKYPQRSIERPQTELAVRGPNEAFNESLNTQIGQLRRRFRDPTLQFQAIPMGARQHEPVALAYVSGLTNPVLIATVAERLSRVAIAGRASATVIAGLIRDQPRSIFPTIRSTERVDVACQALLEGKVVVLVDGDPFVLIAPAPLADFYRTGMDYSGAWYDTSFVRFIRIVGWAIGVYLPGLYIALTEVNLNLLPSALLVMTAGSHAGLPFPPVVEALLMVFVIEVLREAALRLPKTLSVTIGTVGAIVVGTAVVKAGLVSPQMIVVITLTALSFYSAPVYELTGTWRVVNFLMLLAGSMAGVYGLVLVTVWLVGTLISLTSFGVPYFVPVAPFRAAGWRDLVVRMPWTLWRKRPVTAHPRGLRSMDPPVAVPPWPWDGTKP